MSGFQEGKNVSTLKDELKTLFEVTNKTSIPNERKKREAVTKSQNIKNVRKLQHNIKFKDTPDQKAKKIIAEHELLCNDDGHKDVCKELFMTLKSRAENKFSNHHDNNKELITMQENVKNEIIDNTNPVRKISPDISKRETNPSYINDILRPVKTVSNDRHIYSYYDSDRLQQIQQPYVQPMVHLNDHVNPQIRDQCLLKRLMRQTYPNLDGKVKLN